MLQYLELFLVTLLLLQDFSQSLHLVEVRIPNYIIKGSAAQLECLYDLDGEALYSVKWYKDGNEFYRYVPRDMPPAQTFSLPGVLVDIHNSNDEIVTLRELNLQSSGRFRCEVSGEAPWFQTVTEHGDMIVVSLPDQGPPKISGSVPHYQIGDWVRLNCTSGRSKPSVELSWFVNGEAAEPQVLRKYDTIIWGREALETSTLGLQFRVEQHHFQNGEMKLKCVASLSTFYWRSSEVSIEDDQSQKDPALESRDNIYASNSRADPVKSTSLRESFVNKILSTLIQPNAASKTDATVSIKSLIIALLLSMSLITATHFLESLYLSSFFRLISTQSEKQNSTIHSDRAEGCENVKEKMFQQIVENVLQKYASYLFITDFNKDMSELLIMLRVMERNKEVFISICVVQQLQTANEASISFNNARAILFSSSSLLSTTLKFCFSSLSRIQYNVEYLKSR